MTILCVLPTNAQHTDQSMQDEHNALMALVSVNQSTHTAGNSGLWSSPSTWSSGSVPGNGAKVVIPSGISVVYDIANNASLDWVRVDGTLSFSTNTNTAMTVDTIVVSADGEWDQGTVNSPIAKNVTSTITFSDTGPITDPYQLSRGFISHGRVRIYGSPVTSFLQATSGLSQGATTVNVGGTASGWKTGDALVIGSMKLRIAPYVAEPTDERKTITSISGSTVSFDSGLSFPRKVDFSEFQLYPYIANLTRNVVFKSANSGEVSRRGHVMFMHNPDVDVRYASFIALGRTRKDIDVTDTGTSPPPLGNNPRGRYAIHFHRTGDLDLNAPQGHIQGCSVVDATSWAYVNHAGNVLFEDNVAYKSFGAAFVTESGGEYGTFRRNLAADTRGRGFIKDGTDTRDLARSGVGFWFQGGNLVVEDNVATGAITGFSFFVRGSAQNQSIPKQNLLDPEAAGGLKSADSPDVPIGRFKGNRAYGCNDGLFTVDVEINGSYPTDSVFEDFVSLNAAGYYGIQLEYYRNTTFKNVKVLRDSDYPGDSQYNGTWAISANHLIDHLYDWSVRAPDRIDGVYIRGYYNGINNDEGDLGGPQPERKGKLEILNSSLDFQGPGTAIHNSGTVYGQPMVVYLNKSDLLPFPTFNPPAGTYNGSQDVTISSLPGANIYYVIGGQGYQQPSLESLLKSSSWRQYDGNPITISDNKKLIAIAFKNGVKSRPRSGNYTLNPN